MQMLYNITVLEHMAVCDSIEKIEVITLRYIIYINGEYDEN